MVTIVRGGGVFGARSAMEPEAGSGKNGSVAKKARWVVQRAEENGGARESRTPDLYSAIVALYQLSYDPICN